VFRRVQKPRTNDRSAPDRILNVLTLEKKKKKKKKENQCLPAGKGGTMSVDQNWGGRLDKVRHKKGLSIN